jgi:type II secretory pathway component GspD/PulD (secretin)
LKFSFVKISVLLLAIFSFHGPVSADNTAKLGALEFKDADLIDVVRVISEMSNMNVVVTPDIKNLKVTLFLRNVTVLSAVEIICRINGLWYRRDVNTNTFRIMTKKEYSEDLVIHRHEHTKIFTMHNLNVALVADAIENLYGSRVKLSSSGPSFGAAGSSGSANGGASSGSGSGSGVSENLNLADELSIDQLSRLMKGGTKNNIVSAHRLQGLSNQEEPIYVSVVSEHNLVLVRTGDKRALAQIKSLIAKLDRPIPQVLLEMKIIDVLIDDSFTSVFNFNANGVGIQGDSAAPILLGNNGLSNEGSFIFEYMSGQLKANIEFLQKNKRVNILSTPMVLASNNRPSSLFVGEEQVIVTGYSTENVERRSADGSIVSSSIIVPNTEIKNVGNSIVITPFINVHDGTITLDINQTNSSLRAGGGNISLLSAQGEVKVLSIATVNTADLKGTVIVKDNHTIAVGGLIRETDTDNTSAVPGLSDIPFLGWFFKSASKIKQRSELILMITPHLLKNPEDGEFNQSSLLANNKELTLDELALQCRYLCE